MQNPKILGQFKTIGCTALLVLLVGCQPSPSEDAAQAAQNADAIATEQAEHLSDDPQPTVSAVADGFEDDTEPTEQAADQRFAGVSSDVADLLERMESCYSLAADAKSGEMSAAEAGDLQSQLGCDEIESDISRTLKQHSDQPKVAQLIQQMKATRR